MAQPVLSFLESLEAQGRSPLEAKKSLAELAAPRVSTKDLSYSELAAQVCSLCAEDHELWTLIGAWNRSRSGDLSIDELPAAPPECGRRLLQPLYSLLWVVSGVTHSCHEQKPLNDSQLKSAARAEVTPLVLLHSL